MSSRVGWKFIDPDTLQEFSWEVNPNQDGGSASIVKSLGYAVNAATHRDSTGTDRIGTVAYLTNIEQETFAYSGNVYTVQQYNDLVSWCELDKAVIMVDDLGRAKLVYITEFKVSRVRARQHPFKHAYSFKGIVLENLPNVVV